MLGRDFVVEFVELAEAGAGQRGLDPALHVHALQSRALCLQVHRVVQLVVYPQLPIDFCGSLTVMPCEHRCFVLVPSLHVVLLDGPHGHACVVGYQLRLREQVLAIDAPADLARYTRL